MSSEWAFHELPGQYVKSLATLDQFRSINLVLSSLVPNSLRLAKSKMAKFRSILSSRRNDYKNYNYIDYYSHNFNYFQNSIFLFNGHCIICF